jgi:hypothetical protein
MKFLGVFPKIYEKRFRLCKIIKELNNAKHSKNLLFENHTIIF